MDRTGFTVQMLFMAATRTLIGIVLGLILINSCSRERSINQSDEGADGYPAWSPDARTIAYFASYPSDSGDFPDDWLQTISLGSKVVDSVWHVPRGLVVWDLGWSPDSRWLVFSSSIGIFKILASGDSLRQLTQGEFHKSPSWSLSLDRIYYSQATHPTGGVFSLSLEGDSQERVIPSDSGVSILSRFRDFDSLLVTRYVKSELCLSTCSAESGWLGPPIVCGLYSVDVIRMDRSNMYIYFLGKPSLDGMWSIYSLRRNDRKLERIAEGQAFDLSPSDSTIVVAGLTPPRGLKLIDISTKMSVPLTRQR